MSMGTTSGSGGGRRGRRGRDRGAAMSEINVTPLVDVMLVLLIIFMVTAPMLTAGVPVDLPDSQAEALKTEQKTITVSMDGEGRIFLDDQELAPGELGDRLAGRPMEWDARNGVIARLSEKHGIATPLNGMAATGADMSNLRQIPVRHSASCSSF